MTGRGGRTFNFIRGGGGGKQNNLYADRGNEYDRRNDGSNRNELNFTSNRNRSIRRVPRNFIQHRLDEDVSMDGEQQRHPFNRGRGRGNPLRGSQQRRGFNNRRGRPDSQSQHAFGPGWHRIIITNGSQYDRDFILNTIASLSRTPYQPIAYSVLGPNSVFFVESRPAAEAIAACSTKFSGPDSHPIILRVDSYGAPPTAPMIGPVEDRLKATLTRRYDASGPVLDLSNFPGSPDLVLDFYVPLFRPSVVMKIFTLLSDVLNSLLVLDISNNRLTSLDAFQKLTTLTPNLKALNVGNNKLREIYPLDRIKGLPLVEINLEQNSLCEKFPNRDDYIRAVRKYFPKVIKLDGIEAPPLATFEIEEEKAIIPRILPGFTCNEDARKVVMTFLEQYLGIYDTDNREPLLDAYHDEAVMTIQASYLRAGNPQIEHSYTRLSPYISEARNLVSRSQETSRLERCFHQGKLDIVAFLNRLPKTSHDLQGLTVDLTVAMPNLINFCVTGCFKERNGARETSLRYFQRTFMLIPLNNGFVIISEMLFVTNATPEQIKVAFKVRAPTTTSTVVPGTSEPIRDLPDIPSLSIGPSNEEKKAQLVVQFARESTMNETWAMKCLNENEWNYEKSALVFTELHKNGQIPAEAFVKQV